MDSISKILNGIRENSANDEVLEEFLQELFDLEYRGLFQWKNRYRELVSEYAEKR